MSTVGSPNIKYMLLGVQDKDLLPAYLNPFERQEHVMRRPLISQAQEMAAFEAGQIFNANKRLVVAVVFELYSIYHAPLPLWRYYR